MKLLFLDIHGVLITEQWLNKLDRDEKKYSLMDNSGFCPIAYNNLMTLLELSPDVDVVISSTMRRYVSLD